MNHKQRRNQFLNEATIGAFQIITWRGAASEMEMICIAKDKATGGCCSFLTPEA